MKMSNYGKRTKYKQYVHLGLVKIYSAVNSYCQSPRNSH